MYKIILYGTNTKLTVDSNKLVSLDALLDTTYVSVELDCYFIRPHDEFQGEEFDSPGGISDSTTLHRGKYDVETLFLEQDDYRVKDKAIKEVFKRRYKYLEIISYDLDSTEQPEDKVIPVFLSGKSYSQEGKLKNHTLTIYKKYGEGQV